MSTWEDRREGRRRFMRQNFLWLAPLGLLAMVGLFFGLGHLVEWLWRVTVGDIFGFRAISFWQAWGFMLLSQILFKANMQPMARTGSMYRSPFRRDDEPAARPSEPGSET
jgi:hypothetical protein